jgi:hypothetical protein
MTYRERVVKTKLQEGHGAMRMLFWLDTTAEGVADDEADEADESNVNPNNAFAPDRLALPEGSTP